MEKETIINTLANFEIASEVISVIHGPRFTEFHIILANPSQLSKLLRRAKDIAFSLGLTETVSIKPIRGTSQLALTIPNEVMTPLSLKDLNKDVNFSNYKLPIVLGKTIQGETVVKDLTKLPHLLISGQTGSGKSVFLNSLICNLLHRDDVKFYMIDFKKVELTRYDGVKSLLAKVDTNPFDAQLTLTQLKKEMELRFTTFQKANVVNIEEYKALGFKLPYIILIIDEMADLIYASKKNAENLLANLAQKARAAGIHIILSTQRPSVQVVTGIIKANIPARISFALPSRVDSRVILDQGGAEQLLGNGDMLCKTTDETHPLRVQAPFLSDEEIANYISLNN